MNHKELDSKFLFDEMAEFILGWMSNMASLQMPVGPSVATIIAILEEHKKILFETLVEMREEGYPL